MSRDQQNCREAGGPPRLPALSFAERAWAADALASGSGLFQVAERLGVSPVIIIANVDTRLTSKYIAAIKTVRAVGATVRLRKPKPMKRKLIKAAGC